jgi:hypothetical protein
MKTLPLVTLVLALGAHAQTPAPSATPALTPEQKMAMPVEKVAKNIQVLNGMPMNQLAGTMSFIAGSLGVKCDYCHGQDFSSDDKAEKKTARKMIAMQLALNKQTFEGKPEVSCYTCHRGDVRPRAVPSLEPADWKEKEPAWSRPEMAKGAPEPKAEELFARFVEASGGQAALTKHRTRLTTGTETDSEGRTESFDVLKKAPLQYVATATSKAPDGKTVKSVQAHDGARFWVQHGDRKPNMIWTPQTAVIRRSAEFATPLELLALKDAKVRGLSKNGARSAWVVDAAAPDGRRERLFFDEKTGLLARRVVTAETYLGRLQYSVEYDDYRDVDGAKLPFVCRWAAAGHGWTETVTAVKNDVEAPDDRFRMPAGS